LRLRRAKPASAGKDKACLLQRGGMARDTGEFGVRA
jgi:hypothetical protein